MNDHMGSINKESDPLENFTEEQLSDLGKSIDTLEQEEQKIKEEAREDRELRKLTKKPFYRLRKSPIEIINRTLFFIFLGSFLFSFISIYTVSHWWLVIYVISAFSCILYTPNRKALKELLDAWPNVIDLMKVIRK